jgi:hypothetical protein
MAIKKNQTLQEIKDQISHCKQKLQDRPTKKGKEYWSKKLKALQKEKHNTAMRDWRASTSMTPSSKNLPAFSTPASAPSSSQQIQGILVQGGSTNTPSTLPTTPSENPNHIVPAASRLVGSSPRPRVLCLQCRSNTLVSTSK